MKYSLAAELLLAGTALAKLPEISIEKRDKHNHGRTKNVARGFVKRQDNTLETTVFSGVGYVSGGAYYANVTVGTPPQLQVLLLDTGSSDMYLDASSSSACQSNGPHSCVATDFTPGQSSTYEVVEEAPAFNATYGDGSTANGPYAQDTVCINDICLDNVQFGLATEVDSAVGPSIGLLGVGYSYGEAVSDGDQFYPNIPDALTAAGVTNSRLYSLYLNDYSGVTGSILFGGIDTSKYTGSLETVNMLPDPQTGYVDRFITVVTGLKTSAGGNSHTVFSGGATGLNAYSANSGSLPVLLDSGSSAWSVPSSVFLDLVNQYPFIDSRSGFASCNDINSDDHITVTFDGSIDIDIPITEWVTPVYDPESGELGKLNNGEPACAVGIIPSSGTGLGFDTMGDAVMRSMYIVYDLDNGQMSLAQANTDSSSSSVKAVPAGLGGVQKVAKNYEGTSPNSFTVLPSVSATENFSPSTAKSAVGTATGVAAVPTEAQVQGLGDDSGSAGSGGSGGSGSAAPRDFDSTALWFTGAAAVFAVLGAGLML